MLPDAQAEPGKINVQQVIAATKKLLQQLALGSGHLPLVRIVSDRRRLLRRH